MRFLIDAHALIWFLEGNSALPKANRRLIADSQNEIFVSIASLWEIAVKISIGKLTLANPLADVIKQLDIENVEILTITPKHILYVSTLPLHHHDPFDRIIVSQAIVEKPRFYQRGRNV